jgi:hypothetical protein
MQAGAGGEVTIPTSFRLLRAQAGEIHQLDQRAVPVGQRAQPGGQGAAGRTPRSARLSATSLVAAFERFLGGSYGRSPEVFARPVTMTEGHSLLRPRISDPHLDQLPGQGC